jgi:catechol 2,3-dioxygenase-like lactoylglutathione lyase family enzyme
VSQLIPLLNVEDVEASIAFYEKALGAVVESHWESDGATRWARIGFDGGKLMLNAPDGAESRARRDRSEFADTVLYLMCDDAPARRELLRAAGFDVGEISHEDYGNDEFALRDPDGYAIRFSSPRS